MADVIQLNRYRPFVGSPVEEMQAEPRDPWLESFGRQLADEATGEDAFYICLNRPLIDRMLALVSDMEAVLSTCGLKAPSHGAFEPSIATIVSELRHSTHVLWLAQADHYAMLAAVFRRRMERYDRFCEVINAPR